LSSHAPNTTRNLVAVSEKKSLHMLVCHFLPKTELLSVITPDSIGAAGGGGACQRDEDSKRRQGESGVAWVR
jgi:hypothetical protein